jgi:hypothetical protein
MLVHALPYRDNRMIGTLQALLVAVLAVLPGALFTIAQERSGATWAWRQTDASTLIFRFLSFSAVFHVVFAWLTYHAYQNLIVTHAIADGKTISWWWYGALLLYVVVPYLCGVLTEKARRWDEDPCWLKRAGSWLAALYAGRYPELRAWDWFFSKAPSGVIRMQLQNDKWKVGVFDDRSFASSYGEDGDLYFSDQYIVDEDDGVFVPDATGKPQTAGAALLIRWSEIRYLDFAKWGKPNADGGSPPAQPPETHSSDEGSGNG